MVGFFDETNIDDTDGEGIKCESVAEADYTNHTQNKDFYILSNNLPTNKWKLPEISSSVPTKEKGSLLCGATTTENIQDYLVFHNDRRNGALISQLHSTIIYSNYLNVWQVLFCDCGLSHR